MVGRSRRPRAALGLCALATTLAACRSHVPAATAGGSTRSYSQALRATPGGVDLLTYHGDNARTGWNRRETTLTPANVRPATFGLLARASDVEGDVSATPLFASNLRVHDQRSGADAMADVLFVATMDDHVYALDADDLGVMWHFDFEGRHAPLASDLQSCQGPYPTGVFGTPVVSPDRTTLYVVGRVAGATTGDSWLQGYALSTHDGSVLARFRVGETLSGSTRTPIAIDAVDRGTPVHVVFNTNMFNQRSALLLQGNYLYMSVGGICDVPGFRGWLLAYDVTRLSEASPPAGVFVPSPQGGGGMWAAGGQAGDGASVFTVVGNGRAAMRAGTPDDHRSIADAVVRLGPTLALDAHACFHAQTLGPCGAGDAANLSNVFMGRNAELLARDEIPDSDPAMDIGGPDEDFGASGPMLVPPAELAGNMGVDNGRRLLAAGGKDGFLYLVDRDHMGGVGPSPLATDADFANLVGAELWGQELFTHSTSGGILATPAYFETRSGRYLYIIGVDPISSHPETPRGLAALRLRSATDPTPAQCAAQYREVAWHTSQLPCPTIWGSAARPGYELAWSSTGPTRGSSAFVSSNGYDDGIVWVMFERGGVDSGLVQAYAADMGAGTGMSATPIWTSDMVAGDHVPGAPYQYGTPFVANGRLYVHGSTFVAMYGLRDGHVAPPPPPTDAGGPVAPPPDCEPGVAWETDGAPFMAHYCTSCHAEYNGLGFIQGRAGLVADAIAPTDGSRPTMPLVRDATMPPPLPTDAERTRIARWLRCGAPEAHTRLHAGFAAIAAFAGDATFVAPTAPGMLSMDRLMGAAIDNPFAPAVPDAVFAVDRSGPAAWSVPVPGAGHYLVTLYFADNACASTSDPTCHAPFDVQLAGTTWLRGFDVLAAAGAPRRAVMRTTSVDLGPGRTLSLAIGAAGRLQAIDVMLGGRCANDADCPGGLRCAGGACAASGSMAGDAGGATVDSGSSMASDAGGVAARDGGLARDGGAAPSGFDSGAGPTDSGATGSGHGSGCFVAHPGRGATAPWAVVLVLLAAALGRMGRDDDDES